MTIDEIFYKAYASRDPRFDGVFYVGVKTTGIYCRPICPARMPKIENFSFYKSPEAAEKAGLRACLRCRPELAPGQTLLDEAHRLAEQLALRMGDGENNLEDIAHEFGISSRHLRRLIKCEYGVSPVELVTTRRLLLAKQLLAETTLSIIDIAFACGFNSLRRFNDAFKQRFTLPPSKLRKENKNIGIAKHSVVLKLAYREPFDWKGLLEFLKKRVLVGVEIIEEGVYTRSVEIKACKGWIQVTKVVDKALLQVEVSLSLVPVMGELLKRVRNLFDLDARPDVIASHLSQDPFLNADIVKNPGLRVPGAFDGFELAVRTILGQQVSVQVATTISCRFAKAFGEPFNTPFEGIYALSPRADKIAGLKLEQVAEQGIIRTRAESIIDLAKEVSSKRIKLDSSSHPDTVVEKLTAIKGIGRWTAQYVVMRALHFPDAFPKEDVALQKRMGKVSAKKAEELSQVWRPWRSYAVLHVWQKP